MFGKLVEMFVNKEYEKTNVRYVGLDIWGSPRYEHDWKTVYSIRRDAMAVAIAVVGIVVGIVVTSFMAFGNNNETEVVEEATTTTVVVEETTTTTEVLYDVVYGPEYIAPDHEVEYVCDTPTSSNEWALTGVYSGIGIDWQEMANRNVVFEWKAGEKMLPFFKEAVNLFIQYTRADVRVEIEGYNPKPEEFVIPVNKVPDLGDFAAQVVRYYDDSQVVVHRHPTLGYSYYTGLLRSGETWMEVEQKMEEDGYEYGLVHLFLHEIGHVYGLDHTHEQEGEQVDSIMSYESDPYISHYLPGDIAGLKEVFC